MIGKKDNHGIFNQYRAIILEQTQDGGVSDILNKINSSSLDSKSKELLNNLFKNDKVVNIFSTMAMQQPVGDEDTAGYSSYPESGPATDQDDEDTANPRGKSPYKKEEMPKADNRSGAEMVGRGEGSSEYTDIYGNPIAPPEENAEDTEDKGKYNWATGCFEKETKEECEERKKRHAIAKNSLASI